MSWLVYLSFVSLLSLFKDAAAQAVPSINNACGVCSYGQPRYYGGWWTTAAVASTTAIEAVTLVFATNDDGTTSTSTIFNFPSNAAVPATDPAGYPVYTKTLTYGSLTVTTALTWPTGYVSYQTGASWTGAVPASTTSGRINTAPDTCSTAANGSFSTYDSVISPVFLTPTSSPIAGPTFATFNPALWWQWTFYDDGQSDANCFAVYPSTVFSNYATVLPSFPIYEYCSAPTELVCAPVALQTVAYLTVTSHHSGPGDWHPSSSVHDTSHISATVESQLTSPTSASEGASTTSATAAQIATSKGAVVTIAVNRTVQVAATTADSEQSTSTETVTTRALENPHDSRSIIRTSPFDTASREAAATSESSQVKGSITRSWAIVVASVLLLHIVSWDEVI